MAWKCRAHTWSEPGVHKQKWPGSSQNMSLPLILAANLKYETLSSLQASTRTLILLNLLFVFTRFFFSLPFSTQSSNGIQNHPHNILATYICPSWHFFTYFSPETKRGKKSNLSSLKVVWVRCLIINSPVINSLVDDIVWRLAYPSSPLSSSQFFDFLWSFKWSVVRQIVPGEDNNLSTCSSRAGSFRNVKKEERRMRSTLEREMRVGEGVKEKWSNQLDRITLEKHGNSVMSCFWRDILKLGFGLLLFWVVKAPKFQIRFWAKPCEENV